MKAAILYPGENVPRIADLPEPVVQSDQELLLKVIAVAIKHLDKSRASGKHYSGNVPATGGQIIGGDGVCLLADGSRVYCMGVSGMLAEKAIVQQDRMVHIPDQLDDATAAALPNAVIGAAMALKFRADIKPGDVVLINGATGFTGKVAVQIARHYGASSIIATGRNQASLDGLLKLGADKIIQLGEDGELFKSEFRAIHAQTPVDIVIDYLWGRTAELIFDCLKGDGRYSRRTRYVVVGSMSGDSVNLSAATMRSTDLQLTGSGLGAWSKQQVGLLFTSILPEMFELAAGGKLGVATIPIQMADIAQLWDLEVPGGKRLVVMI